LKKRLKHDKVF